MFFQSGTKWVPDEICTLIKGSTLPIVDKISDLLYYFAATVPLIVGFINFYMIKCLNLHASKFSSSKSKQNDNKTIFINLIIQTFQPLIGQGPLIIFHFYLKSTGNNIYIVWRILDGLTALSLISNILFSIVLLKDVRNAIFRRKSNKVVNKAMNVGKIKANIGLKLKQRKS
uniref:G-protein coupled receptors family 1 profile domain-containing protein n=1 Tax=Strongyloides venezuelensis TaxID=75913 RepID=A0A0K0FE86_STRVS